jgi:hypothetical protein
MFTEFFKEQETMFGSDNLNILVQCFEQWLFVAYLPSEQTNQLLSFGLVVRYLLIETGRVRAARNSDG